MIDGTGWRRCRRRRRSRPMRRRCCSWCSAGAGHGAVLGRTLHRRAGGGARLSPARPGSMSTALTAAFGLSALLAASNHFAITQSGSAPPLNAMRAAAGTDDDWKQEQAAEPADPACGNRWHTNPKDRVVLRDLPPHRSSSIRPIHARCATRRASIIRRRSACSDLLGAERSQAPSRGESQRLRRTLDVTTANSSAPSRRSLRLHHPIVDKSEGSTLPSLSSSFSTESGPGSADLRRGRRGRSTA